MANVHLGLVLRWLIAVAVWLGKWRANGQTNKLAYKVQNKTTVQKRKENNLALTLLCQLSLRLGQLVLNLTKGAGHAKRSQDKGGRGVRAKKLGQEDINMRLGGWGETSLASFWLLFLVFFFFAFGLLIPGHPLPPRSLWLFMVQHASI